MKPSEAILGPPNEELQHRYHGQRLHFENLLSYLDDEAERRAKFEADVLERLTRLEADASPPEELDPTKPLYAGDGAPRVVAYEPEPEGSEEL